MAASYQKSKGRKWSDGGFFGLPKSIIQHPNFIRLSAHANKLLIDLGEQFKGKNNGDLCATWSFMRERGWRSKETLNNSLRELEHYGLIVCTQYGGLNRPSLYGFTWLDLDKASKDVAWKVGETPQIWKEIRPDFIRPSKKQERQAG